MSSNTNTAATPKQNLNNILSHFSTFVIALAGKPEHAPFNTIFQSLETWSKSNPQNRVYNAHEESNLSKLWTEYFHPIPGEENDISGKGYTERLLPQVTKIDKLVSYITGSFRHTTVYDGDTCQESERNGGGSYGPNVPEEKRRHNH